MSEKIKSYKCSGYLFCSYELLELSIPKITIDELTEKNIKPTKFKWNFNSNNINLILILELYNNKGKIFKTFESTEFSKVLQDLLREKQLLFNCIDNIIISKTKEEIFSYLEVTSECKECVFKDICPVRDN